MNWVILMERQQLFILLIIITNMQYLLCARKFANNYTCIILCNHYCLSLYEASTIITLILKVKKLNLRKVGRLSMLRF